MEEREKSVTKYYFDNSATTRMNDSVLAAMIPYFQDVYGNPSSIYTLGRDAREGYIHASEQTANSIGAEASEIYFTSGGSESDNWALKCGAAYMRKEGKNHIISTAFEHPAILQSLKLLENNGVKVTYIKPDHNGIIEPAKVEAAITDDTGLISIMFVNNEIGTIQPIERIGELCRSKGILLHTDAVQAVGNVPIDVRKCNIDLMSISGHKINGPKGVGILYMRQGLWLDPLIDGGGQEKGRRAGTENVPGIVGFGVAIQEATNLVDKKQCKLRPMQKRIMEELEKIPGCHLVGSRNERICTNINICVEALEAKKIVYELDNNYGVAISSVSACGCKESRPSHVLMSMGYDEESSKSSIRITMSMDTTESEVDILIEAVKDTIQRLRRQVKNES